MNFNACATSKTCHLCSNPLNGDAVRNHDHQTGNFLGMAHNKCNLQYKNPKQNNKVMVPIVFHNLRGYDGHLIIQALNKNENIHVIAKTLESYLSFKMDNFKFIDSFLFMSTSLDNLVKNCSAFPHMTRIFNDPNLLRKGVYPYEYMDSFTKFDKTKLPHIGKFFSKLSDSNVKQEDYDWACKMWKDNNCRTMKDYADLYLKTDIVLLADVFEGFRNFALKTYELDPAHYISAPSLSWDAMLKYTKVELELLQDIDMHLFIEKGIRGGYSGISHRLANANNPYISNHDETAPNSYITYLDANNLYGHAMCELLPYG